MSRLGSTGTIKVAFATTIASATLAPTAAEAAAAIDLTPQMRRDGLTTPRSGATIDASDASTRVNKTAPGNIDQGLLTFRGLRDSVVADDDAYAAVPEDAAGYFIVRRFGGSGVAFAAAQLVEVYKGSIISREMQPIGDEVQNFVATFSIENSTQSIAILA